MYDIYIYMYYKYQVCFSLHLFSRTVEGCTSLCGVKSILQVPTRNLQLGFLNPFVVGSEEIYIYVYIFICIYNFI